MIGGTGGARRIEDILGGTAGGISGESAGGSVGDPSRDIHGDRSGDISGGSRSANPADLAARPGDAAASKTDARRSCPSAAGVATGEQIRRQRSARDRPEENLSGYGPGARLGALRLAGRSLRVPQANRRFKALSSVRRTPTPRLFHCSSPHAATAFQCPKFDRWHRPACFRLANTPARQKAVSDFRKPISAFHMQQLNLPP
jgi:hypothetical protein